MNLRNFFVGRSIGFIVLLILVAIFLGFYSLNNYVYQEKQAEISTINNSINIEDLTETLMPVFVWKYEQDDTLNLDGNPQNNVFLEVTYPNQTTRRKFIQTTPGSCNDLPDSDKDSVLNSSDMQCYYAGLGYRFKITQAENAYLVKRKTFEEASPEYNPTPTDYETIMEIPLTN